MRSKSSTQGGTKLSQEAADSLALEWDSTSWPTIQEWFLIARAREIPNLAPMRPGIHLNLGAGFRNIGDAIPLDREHGWDADQEPIPYRDESVSGIWAHAFLGYVADPVAVLAECQRVLAPGGVMNIVEPHGLSDLWAEDVRRKNRFTEETWKNLMANRYWDPQADRARRVNFAVRSCFILGVVWRNLSLFTQLIKTSD